jgi:catechol 2,3-dioxygenase-like lactoylglutathione lyase family enzyme
MFLGIDHTAIVVTDTDRSLAFYRYALGFRVAGEAHNYGPEQEHLNQVFGANLRITGLKADRGPGIEFLEYIAPPGGRDLPTDTKANDLVFWTTQLVVEDLPAQVGALRGFGAKLISKSASPRAQIVRDPDGHALRVSSSGGRSTNRADEFSSRELRHDYTSGGSPNLQRVQAPGHSGN